MADLTNALKDTMPANALEGSEAWIILPVDPENTADLLYPQEVVDLIQSTVKDNTNGTVAQQTKYTPLDFETSTELGTTRRGTAACQYDPRYADPTNDNKVCKAYRIYSESVLLSKKREL